jgi:site-specific recombinase XerD
MDRISPWYERDATQNPEGALLLEWIKGFLLDRRSQGLSERSVGFYSEKLQGFYTYCQSNNVKSIEEISPHFLRTYFLRLDQSGHNAGGCHAFFRTLRAFYNWCETEIDDENFRNPMRKIKAPRVKIEPLEPINIEHIEKMLKECQDTVFGLRDRAILLVLMDTGARASELLSLDRKDVDLISGAVQIRRGKGNKARVAYIGRTTRLALRKYMQYIPREIEYLWLSREGSRLSYGGLRSIMRRLADRADVPTLSIHSFRRYFALEMLRSGVDVFSLQLLMGHADIQVLRRYLKQTNNDTFEAHMKGRPVDKFNL